MTRLGDRAPDFSWVPTRALWSEIVPGLWIGGTHDADTVRYGREVLNKWQIEDAEITPEEFDAVVTLYAYARPVDWGVEELRWGFGDGKMEYVDLATLAETVEWGHRRFKAGKRVLFRCQAGLNRSSLVAALVLMKEGMEADEVIRLIRDRRSPQALCNGDFETYLRGLAVATGVQ